MKGETPDVAEGVGVRLVLIINSLARGGAETQLLRLAGELVRRGWVVTLITFLPDNDLSDEAARQGVENVALRSDGRRAVTVVPAISKIVRDRHADVVLSFLYHSNIVARLVGLRHRIPVVCSVRNEYFGSQRRERLLRWTDRLAIATVANSRTTADSLRRRGLVSPERSGVILNAIDEDAFRALPEARARVRASLDIASGQFLWLCAARLQPQKDLPNLISAVQLLAGRGVPVRVVVAGDGALRQQLEAMLTTAGLQEHVSFLGLRSDIPELLAACDAVVLPSAYEGLPNIVMEAMAAGRPVVATDVGGVRELVNHDITGLVVPASDPARLSLAMEALMGLPEEQRRQMAERAVLRIRQLCGHREVMDQWEALLLQGAGRGKNPEVGPRGAPR